MRAACHAQPRGISGCLQALLQSSHMYAEAKHSFARHGVLVDNVAVDVAAMQKQKSSAVEGLTKGIEGLFKKNKVSPVAEVQCPLRSPSNLSQASRHPET